MLYKRFVCFVIYRLIVQARRNLGLFQHHDAITGTEKAKVVLDYADKLMKSITDIQQVAQSVFMILPIILGLYFQALNVRLLSLRMAFAKLFVSVRK